MFNNLNADLNIKDNFTGELSTRGVDGSLGVVGGGNSSGIPY
jgi:hypothetical protein